MDNHSQSTWKADLILLAGLAAAAVVSAATLIAAVPADRQQLGLATPPFGYQRVILAQVACSLVLSWAIARALGAAAPVWKAPWMVLAYGAAAILVVGVSLVDESVVGNWTAGVVVDRLLETNHAGYVPRLIVRVVWCVALQLPWSLGTQALMSTRRRRRPVFTTGNLLALGMVIAVFVPVSDLAVLIEQQTGLVQTAWQEKRVHDALLLTRRLCDLGSTTEILTPYVDFGQDPAGREGKPVYLAPPKALNALNGDYGTIAENAERHATAAATDVTQSRRLAWDLWRLGRLDDAKAALAPIATEDPEAANLMARLCSEDGDVEATRRWFETSLQAARAKRSSDPAREELYLNFEELAYQGLAQIAGERGDFSQAEKCLFDGLHAMEKTKSPQRVASFYRSLGMHYESTGHLVKAVEYLRKAHELDPQRHPEPEGVLVKALSIGAPVGLARPASSRYK